MRFQVPQFTEVEDKIVGPLTFKQFIYLAGAGGACIVIYTLMPRFLAFILIAPVALFGVALAFFKVHGRPFIRVVESFLKYSVASKLYIWKHGEKAVAPKKEEESEPIAVPKLSESKLGDLKWSLDVKQNIEPRAFGALSVNEGKIDEIEQ